LPSPDAGVPVRDAKPTQPKRMNLRFQDTGSGRGGEA
jgi:hypothetical protein